MLQPIIKKTIVEDIISALLELAKNGEILPGQRIPSERDLATQFNVSRASVREAMKALSFTGVVTIKPGDGTYFNDMSGSSNSHVNAGMITPILLKHRSDFKQVSEARRILEVQMAKLAARRASDESIKKVEKSYNRMTALLNEKNSDGYTQEDIVFHDLLAQSCENDVLYRSYLSISQSTKDMILQGATIPGRNQGAHVLHKNILKALKKGDEEKIVELMETHMDYMEENLSLYFDSLT